MCQYHVQYNIYDALEYKENLWFHCFSAGLGIHHPQKHVLYMGSVKAVADKSIV